MTRPPLPSPRPPSPSTSPPFPTRWGGHSSRQRRDRPSSPLSSSSSSTTTPKTLLSSIVEGTRHPPTPPLSPPTSPIIQSLHGTQARALRTRGPDTEKRVAGSLTSSGDSNLSGVHKDVRPRFPAQLSRVRPSKKKVSTCTETLGHVTQRQQPVTHPFPADHNLAESPAPVLKEPFPLLKVAMRNHAERSHQAPRDASTIQQPQPAHHETPPSPVTQTFGTAHYTSTERDNLQHILSQPLGREYVSRRVQGNASVVYVEGWRAIALANEILGFDGWSSSVVWSNVDFAEKDEGGKWSVGISCQVRVTLKAGAWREDVGCGTSDRMKSQGMAYDTSRKAAITDGIKRALRQFGQVLGNCMYDKQYASALAKMRPTQPKPVCEADCYHGNNGGSSASTADASSAAPKGSGSRGDSGLQRQGTWAQSAASVSTVASKAELTRTRSMVQPLPTNKAPARIPGFRTADVRSDMTSSIVESNLTEVREEDESGFDDDIMAEAEAMGMFEGVIVGSGPASHQDPSASNVAGNAHPGDHERDPKGWKAHYGFG